MIVFHSPFFQVSHTDCLLYTSCVPTCSKRIDPNKENVNEITPRRTRRGGQSNAAESELANNKPTAMPHMSHPSASTKPKQTLNRRKYQMEFNELKSQRNLPEQLMSSKDALEMLVDSYNFGVVERDGVEYYCLPEVNLNEQGEDEEDESNMLGCDYFESLQEMRENLCAFGLPPVAKGSKLSEVKVGELEAWIRCANITALHDASATVPDFADMRPRETRKLLKSLGYTFSDNVGMYVLPGMPIHDSKPGQDRFDKFGDLINHIARFGLETDMEDEVDVSDEERLKLEAFFVQAATFDVW